MNDNLLPAVLYIIGLTVLVLVATMLYTDATQANERYVQLTCFDRMITTHKYILGEIDPITNFRVEDLAIRGNSPYVLLRNLENEDEYQELVWSSGWRCILERRTK